MRSGSVVRLESGDIGIVISQYKDVLRVLLEDYTVLSVNAKNVSKTGRYFDLSIIWEVVKREDQDYRDRMFSRGIKAEQ